MGRKTNFVPRAFRKRLKSPDKEVGEIRMDAELKGSYNSKQIAKEVIVSIPLVIAILLLPALGSGRSILLGQNGLKRSGGGDFSKVQCFFMKRALHIFAALKKLRKEIEKRLI